MKKIVTAFCALWVLACVSFVRAEETSGKFAGMAKVKVVSVDQEEGDMTVFVKFLAVKNPWKHNEAGDAKQFIGKKFLLVPAQNWQAEMVKKFLTKLSVGEEVVIGVTTYGEKVLELVELTYEQRDMVK